MDHTDQSQPDRPNEEGQELKSVTELGMAMVLFYSLIKKDKPEFVNAELPRLVEQYGASWSTTDPKFINALADLRGRYLAKYGAEAANKKAEERLQNTSENLVALVGQYQAHEEFLKNRDTHIADEFIKDLKKYGVQMSPATEEGARTSLAANCQQIRQTSTSPEQYAESIHEAAMAVARSFVPEMPEEYREIASQAAQNLETETSGWLPRGLESRVEADISKTIFVPLPNQKEAAPDLYAAAYWKVAAEHINDYDPVKVAHEASVEARRSNQALSEIGGDQTLGEETHFFEALADRPDTTPAQKKLGLEIDRKLNAEPPETRRAVLVEIVGGALKRVSQNTEKLTQAVGGKVAVIITANLQSQTPGSNTGATPKQAIGAVHNLVSEITAVFGPAIDQEVLEIIKSDVNPRTLPGDKREHHPHLSFTHTKPEGETVDTTKDVVLIHETAIYSHLPDKTLIQDNTGPSGGLHWVTSRIKAKLLGQATGAAERVVSRGFLQGARTVVSGFAKNALGFLKTALPKVIAKVFGATVAGLVVPVVGAVIAFLPEIIKGVKKFVNFINPLRIFGALGNMFGGGGPRGQRKGLSPAIMIIAFIALSPFLTGSTFAPSGLGLPDPLAPALSSPLGNAQFRGGYLIDPISQAGGPGKEFLPPYGPALPCGYTYKYGRPDVDSPSPVSCPIDRGVLTQCPNSIYSHRNGLKAFDFGADHIQVKTTTTGYVTFAYDSSPNGQPGAGGCANQVQIAGWNSSLGTFTVTFGHMEMGLIIGSSGKSPMDLYKAFQACVAAADNPGCKSGGQTPCNCPGAQIDVGTVVGLVDHTGNSTGPHLHYEYTGNGPIVIPIGCGGYTPTSCPNNN